MIHKEFNIKALFHGKNYELELIFRDTVVFVTGESALGKSLVYQIILGEVMDGNVNAECYNYTKIQDLLSNKEKSFGFSNKLVIIDNADILLSSVPWLAEAINLTPSNCYLLFARSAPGVSLSPNVWATLKRDNSKFYLDYKYRE